MRIASLTLLGCLAAFPAVAQGYYQAPPYGYAPPPAYGYAQPAPDAWASAREEWHRARRAEDIARWHAGRMATTMVPTAHSSGRTAIVTVRVGRRTSPGAAGDDTGQRQLIWQTGRGTLYDRHGHKIGKQPWRA